MVEILSKELKETLQGILGKEFEEITKEDLDKIELITLDYFKDFLLDDLLLFNNLKKCILKNYELSKKEINILENLNKLEILELNNCKINSECKLNLQKLKLSFCTNIEIGEIFNESNINEVYLYNCDKITLSNMNKITKLNQITLDEMNITRKMAMDMDKSLIKNINLNNCNINLLARSKIKSLEENKKIKIENKKLVI